jgi:hypothetical protein
MIAKALAQELRDAGWKARADVIGVARRGGYAKVVLEHGYEASPRSFEAVTTSEPSKQSPVAAYAALVVSIIALVFSIAWRCAQ